jgi:hypothetical protein
MIERRLDRQQAYHRQYQLIRNSLLSSVREALTHERNKDALSIIKRLQTHVLRYKYDVAYFV